jgi:division protein CdvB (Snf7/Vps24/ESCRT-III family)
MEWLWEAVEKTNEYVWGPSLETILARAEFKSRAEIATLERRKREAQKKETALTESLFKQSRNEQKTTALAIARNRRSVARFERLLTQISGMSAQLVETNTQHTVGVIMETVTDALSQAQMMRGGPKGMVSTVKKFEQQKARLEMATDALDCVDDDEECYEDEADAILAELMDSQDIALADLPDVPKNGPGSGPAVRSHVGASHVGASHVDASHADASHVDASHADASHADALHVDASHAPAP